MPQFKQIKYTDSCSPQVLREAFVDAVDAFGNWDVRNKEPVVEVGEIELKISEVFGLHLDNQSLMPNHLSDEIKGVWRQFSDDDEATDTFAQGAHKMKQCVDLLVQEQKDRAEVAA